MRAADTHLRALFDADSGRVERFTSSVGDLVIDWSKHLVTDETVGLLLGLAERAGVAERIAAMMAGEPVNITENRRALHTALRADPHVAGMAPAAGEAIPAAALDSARSAETGVVEVLAAVRAERERMAGFARALRAGDRRGATGKPIRTVVNLGIGGSHLGLAMAHEALAAFRTGEVECRFVSSVDPADLASVLGAGLDPAETLFVVVSKSFNTAETLANAGAARHWLTAALGEAETDQHFVAVTADVAAAVDFGVAAEDVFEMWDWVGGRFSLGSAAGLSLMVAVAEDHFAEMLAGMRTVDEHLARQSFATNAAVTMGLLGVWYRNFWGLQTRAVLPYSHRLRLLPAYLQQLVMESNGKRVDAEGNVVGCDTGPVVWGGAGTGGQHSFHQLLHQGTTVVPADFVLFARPDADTGRLREAQRHHQSLVANCIAQSSALAFGDPAHGDPHRELPGNRPSTVIMAPELTPSVLGQLVALYEHETVVQAAVWGINSFDQFGVEHGKKLAEALTASLQTAPSQPATSHDPSAASLMAHYQHLRNP